MKGGTFRASRNASWFVYHEERRSAQVSKSRLSQMSVDELVQRHAALSAEQGRGLEGFSSMIKVNRLAQQIFDINSELKSRPGDQRLALAELFQILIHGYV